MYEPEKILVQNAGIDPGVAALLQNANKGNMDPADIRKMIEDAKKMFMGGFPKPPMPPMPNVPAPMK
jgi:hypothetical protein